MTAICATLGIGRATAYRPVTVRPRYYAKADDRAVAAQITTVVRERASYGYRRITAVVNRAFGTTYNRKRIRRVMAIHAWTLPRAAKRRHTRPHEGLVQRPRSNERWSSDAIEIACWSGEVVEAAFALDCCDRECLAWVAAARALTGEDIRGLMANAVHQRFGGGRPVRPLQWLSDNESMYTALETVIVAERLGLTPITTPVCSPESNGISEAFHHTLRRDYIAGADLSTAAAVIATLPAWVADYNAGRLREVLGDSTWWPLLPESAFAEPDDQPWEHNGADRVFPHRRPNPWPQGDRDYEVTPALDRAALELAMLGVRTLDLGRGPHTDLLVVSLSGTDHIGHAFGPYSREVRDQSARVDRLLGAFLDTLFAERDSGRVVVALTADHGVTPQPEWSAAHGRPGGRMDADSFVRLLDARFDSAFGPGRWIRYLDKGLLVLEADTIAARGVDPSPLLAAFAVEARRLPGVARVDTRASLAAADTATDALARRWVRSVPADLPAALMISVRPGWVFRGARIEASHGHVTDDDAHVPLILWGANVRAGRYDARVAVADLGPTLARLAGVTPSEPLDGRVLVEALR